MRKGNCRLFPCQTGLISQLLHLLQATAGEFGIVSKGVTRSENVLQWVLGHLTELKILLSAL